MNHRFISLIWDYLRQHSMFGIKYFLVVSSVMILSIAGFAFQSFADVPSNYDSNENGVATVSWNQSTYLKNEMGVLQVIEPDMNKNPRVAERLDIHVKSTSDQQGIKVTATETGVSTGIFESKMYFVVHHSSKIEVDTFFVFAPPNDVVVATYIDKTLPVRENSQIEEFAVSSKIRIINPSPLLYHDGCRYHALGSQSYEIYRHSLFGEPRIVDQFSNTLSSTKPDQQILITTDLANRHDTELPFSYHLQITDKRDIVVRLAWLTGTLTPGQSFSPALSWIPDESGIYTATVFLWNSMSDAPVPLCDPKSITVEIKDM